MWHLHGTDGIAIDDAIGDRRRAIRMTIGHDGETRFFACARPATANGQPVGIFETLIAGYIGNVDVGVAVTGIRGAVPDVMHQRAIDESPFLANEYRATERVVVSELAERPRVIALELLRRFHDAIGGLNYEPGV